MELVNYGLEMKNESESVNVSRDLRTGDEKCV
jgi:hypothetical protein